MKWAYSSPLKYAEITRGRPRITKSGLVEESERRPEAQLGLCSGVGYAASTFLLLVYELG